MSTLVFTRHACLEGRRTSRPVLSCARPWSQSWSVISLTRRPSYRPPNRGALRLEGRLTTSRQPHWEGAPSLTWYAKALPKGETSHVDLEWGSSEGFDLRSYWKEEENNLKSVRPGTDATPCPIVQDSLPSINSIRPVTDLAHTWLISDLKELDWTSLNRVSLL